MASAVACPSATCSCPMPASVQPTTLRVMSPQAPLTVSPQASRRSKISGTLSSVIQWIWMHWRVVQSRKPRPKSAAIEAIASAWSPVSTPWTTLTRSMKCPSLVLCAYRPYHFRRTRSFSSSVSQPSRVARMSSG